MQLFGPAEVTAAVGVQFQDHPPKAPVPAGAVKVTVVPRGYVAVHTEPPEVEPGPQWITSGVPVAEGAVISQSVVFKPALKTVSVTSSPDAIVSSLHDPSTAGVGGVALGLAGT